MAIFISLSVTPWSDPGGDAHAPAEAAVPADPDDPTLAVCAPASSPLAGVPASCVVPASGAKSSAEPPEAVSAGPVATPTAVPAPSSEGGTASHTSPTTRTAATDP